jgi:nucleotide-binding universal stress UspA family protein
MKFLIAIGSKEYSGPTLKLGMRVARAFNADVTIAYVGEKISSFSTSEVLMAQENLDNWEVNRRGVDVLEWAHEILKERKYITAEESAEGIGANSLVQTDDDRCEVFLEGTQSDEVKLILRNGEIISQLRDEVSRSEIDVTIIGGSRKRRMAHDLIQYIDSSIFVVNQYNPDQNYRVLLAVNDAANTRKAVKFGVRVAQAFELGVDMLTVEESTIFGDDNKVSTGWAEKIMRRSNTKFTVKNESGALTDIVVSEASDNHIIVLGASQKSPLAKFFRGSKPLKILKSCSCPVLIVKQ